MNLDEAIHLDTRIKDLIDEAKAISKKAKRRKVFCANMAFYHGNDRLKKKICALVGWERNRPPMILPEGEKVDGFVTYSDTQLIDAYHAHVTKHPIDTTDTLRSSEAYDVVYHAVYELLPDCKGCRCFL